jgi:uncharacterized protein
LEPLPPAERIETLDVLRGFALCGILLVNMEQFGWPVYQVLLAEQEWKAGADTVAAWIVRFLAEGKFYPLFSFLFGLGVAIQMERAEARGASFANLFCRRLLVLLGIGLAHAFLIWEGDILAWYALCGFLLLAFRQRQPRTLLAWAVIFLLIPVAGYALIWALMAVGSLVPEIAEVIEQEIRQDEEYYARRTEENLRVFAQGSVGEIFVERARNLAFVWQYAWFYGLTIFAMFLLGLHAGRRRLLQDPEANLKLIRRALIWGLCLGLPANAVYTISFGLGDLQHLTFTSIISLAAIALGGPALCFVYASGITLLLRRGRWRNLFRPFAAAGRMALSNYLLQSLVCTTIFYSYGLGLYGSVGRTAGVGLAVAIYAAQLPFSVWWLKHFRFGPAEWLWRTLTYGKRQPMRL